MIEGLELLREMCEVVPTEMESLSSCMTQEQCSTPLEEVKAKLFCSSDGAWRPRGSLLLCAGEADSMRGNVAAVPLPEESSEVPERFPILPCWMWILAWCDGNLHRMRPKKVTKED